MSEYTEREKVIDKMCKNFSHRDIASQLLSVAEKAGVADLASSCDYSLINTLNQQVIDSVKYRRNMVNLRVLLKEIME